jgi:uncharacterized spore protein YtfJ
MTQATNHSISASIDAVMARADRLFDSARPEAAFAEPVTVDGRTVIAAAEVLIATGFGGGGGSGPTPAPEGEAEATSEGMGAGMGGFAQSRPVAVVIIDGDGVRVEPVVDATKLGIAALTVFGSMFFFLARMLGGSKRAG